MIARNSFFLTTNLGEAVRGSQESRYVFFPNQKDSRDAYVIIKGTEEQVNKFLMNTSVCPHDLDFSEAVYVKIEQLALNTLDSLGLKNNEHTFGYQPPVKGGTKPDIIGYPNYMQGTEGNWNSKFTVNKSLNPATAKGRFQVRNGDGKLIDYIGTNITIDCYRQNKVKLVTTVSESIFSAEIKIFDGVDYPIVCKVHDSSHDITNINFTQYLYNEVMIDVPGGTKGHEVSAGNILLLTRNGEYCAQGDLYCWKKQRTRYGQVEIEVFDIVSGEPITGIATNLTSWWYPQETIYREATSDYKGDSIFDGIIYGYYTVNCSHKDYEPGSTRIYLQDPTQKAKIGLTSKKEVADYVLLFNVPDRGVDFDLLLEVKSRNGKTCTVSPWNRYCAYSRHVTDIQLKSGTEVIKIKKFSISMYMAYVRPSPSYNGYCTQDKVLLDNPAHTFDFLLAETGYNKPRRQLLSGATNLQRSKTTEVTNTSSGKASTTAGHTTLTHVQEYDQKWAVNGGWNWDAYSDSHKDIYGERKRINNFGMTVKELDMDESLDHTTSDQAGGEKFGNPNNVNIDGLGDTKGGWQLGTDVKDLNRCVAEYFSAACFKRPWIQKVFNIKPDAISEARWARMALIPCDPKLKAKAEVYMKYILYAADRFEIQNGKIKRKDKGSNGLSLDLYLQTIKSEDWDSSYWWNFARDSAKKQLGLAVDIYNSQFKTREMVIMQNFTGGSVMSLTNNIAENQSRNCELTIRELRFLWREMKKSYRISRNDSGFMRL